MENLKILVNSEAESKEAQDLLFELGYGFEGNEIKETQEFEYTGVFYLFAYGDDCDLTHSSDRELFNSKPHREITLPELRDLVVLKRNDVRDATHTDGHYSFYVGKGKNYFFSSFDKAWRGTWKNVEILKPIEKPMKEYLRKNSNGTYSYIGTVRLEHASDFMIEIPEGCNIITCEERKCGLVYFHWKSLDSDEFFLKDEKTWSNNFNETLSDFIKKNEGDVKIIWSRQTHPEELPFIDDEPSFDERIKVIKNTFKPKPSLNDQYAEIEKVRQSAWEKQEGGSHYKNLKIQPMQYALENKLDYAQANVVKYVTRHKEKNGKEDLLKAIHNIELMIEFYYGGGE